MVIVESGDVATDRGAGNSGTVAGHGKKDLQLFEEVIPVI